MRIRSGGLALVVALVVGGFTATAAHADVVDAGAGAGELLVVLEPDAAESLDASEEASLHADGGGEPVDEIESMDLDVVAVDDVEQAIADYQERPEVRYVEVNHPVRAASVNDPMFGAQWHLDARSSANRGTVNAEPAWAMASGAGVTVAVVDTGVNRSASDLDTSRFVGGYDFVNGDSDPHDDHVAGHGTHIAGTIGQSTNNGKGAAGVAPKARIMPVKVLDAAGVGTYSGVIDGMLWAVDHGADVVNLSLSGSTFSNALCDAVRRAARSAVVVAASGNEGIGSVSYPAACPGAIGVGSVRYDGTLSPFSNTGSGVDVVAPGGDSDRDQNGDGHPDSILQQTRKNGAWGYWWFEGTSMAAAHVSGVAALVLDVDPDAKVESLLKSTARDAGPSGHDHRYGAGIVDAAAAVSRARPSGDGPGYWLASATGDVHAFGGVDAVSAAAARGSGAVSIEATPSGNGYWILDGEGGVHTAGDARFYGSLPGLRRQGVQIGQADLVDISATPSGKGYWILDGAGGIFTFGDARFYGSIPGLREQGQEIGRADVVAMAPTGSGSGYWLTDDNGGVFTFGDASFRGSIPGLRNAGVRMGEATVVEMVPTPTGRGYWQVDDAGGIFTFGDATYHGSMPAIGAPGPAVGMAASGA